jgi:hypothetical protein
MDEIDVYRAIAGPPEQQVDITLMVRKEGVIRLEESFREDEDEHGKTVGKFYKAETVIFGVGGFVCNRETCG